MKYREAAPPQPRQKTLAALLATGVSVKEAAELIGVSVSYVKVLMKGELFQYEIDEQRKALVGERLNEYTKLVSEQLIPNLRNLIAIRDDEKAPPAARLRAIELINESIVPKAKPRIGGAEMKVSVQLTPEQKAAITTTAQEVEDVRRDRPTS